MTNFLCLQILGPSFLRASSQAALQISPFNHEAEASTRQLLSLLEDLIQAVERLGDLHQCYFFLSHIHG